MRNRPQLRPRKRLAVAASTATLLALAGCGAAEAPGAASSNGDCATPGISPTEVKLGMIYPDTGALSSPFRYSRSGVDARLGLANANGGVHGRTVSYEWRDDESDPGVNSEAARLLVEQSDAFGMIMLTAVAAGSADFLAERGVPVVGIGSGGMWSELPNMFTFANLTGSGSSVDTFGTYARAQGGTRAVFVTLDATASSDDVDGGVTASLQAKGIEIVSHVTYDPAQGGEDVARAMRSAGADVLVGAVTAEVYAEVIAAVRANGVDLKVALNPVGYTPTLLAAYGPAVAGMTIYLGYLPFEADSPDVATFHDAMARYAPELNQPNQEFAMLAYITTDLLLRGLELAGPCPTREGFVNSLREVADYDGSGLLPGPVDLRTSASDLNPCWSFVRVNQAGDAFEPVPAADGTPRWCGERLP